jgi:hypothetical protein
MSALAVVVARVGKTGSITGTNGSDSTATHIMESYPHRYWTDWTVSASSAASTSCPALLVE